MPLGSRRKREDEYVMVDGRMVRVADARTTVPGQADLTLAPGAAEAGVRREAQPAAAAAAPARKGAASGQPSQPSQPSMGETLRAMEQDDAFALREGATNGGGFFASEPLGRADKRALRNKYLVFGAILLACMAVSCCVDQLHFSFRSPVEVVEGLGTWFSVVFASVFDPTHYAEVKASALAGNEFYESIAYQCGTTLKYAVCGIMLALSGMLYQNTFRNPIAAPSMLGVTNGISFAVLILVLQFSTFAVQHIDLYFLYSYIGGLAVLLIVILGGKFVSGKHFNSVNMILMGTIVSQLLGVLNTYIQNTFLTDAAWEVYYDLQQATGYTTNLTYITLVVGLVVSIIPIVLFRFRLNLVSFEDEETRLLGVNPTKLRLLALTCGSIMILTAQVNAGQVAMVSLVVPFVVRAVFGSEFSKQLGGNILVGAIVLVVCGVFATLIVVNLVPVGLNAVVTILALPLFVWMLAIRQRSWD